MRLKAAHFPFSPAKCPVFYGWPIVVAGALGVLMSIPGQTNGVSVFTDPLISAMQMSRTQLSLAYMLGTLGSACILLWAGRLYDRFGSRTVAVVASICLALMLIFLSQSDRIAGQLAGALDLPRPVASFAVMLVGFLGLRFWGQGILTMASQNMVAKWFNRRRGLASGLTGVCVTFGFSGAPWVLNLLIRQLGWRGAWLTMALVVGGIFAAVAWIFFRDNPEQCGLHPDGERPQSPKPGEAALPVAAASEPCWTRPQAARTGVFWVFTVGLALYGLYATGLTFNIVSIFEAAGMTREQAVVIFLPISMIGVVVHLSAGWLSDRLPLNALLVVMLSGMMVSTLGLAYLKPGLPIIALVAGNGLAGGIFALLSGVTWARFFGRRHLGAISGLYMSVSVLFSALGPILFSLSLALSGSYSAASLICMAAAALVLLMALRLRHPQQSA